MNVKPTGTVTIPRTVHEGMIIRPWAREVNSCLQQLRDRIVKTRKGGRGSGNAISWRLTLTYNDPDWEWKVSSHESEVLNGTNGSWVWITPGGGDYKTGAIELDDVTALSITTGTTYIYLKAVVDPDTLVTSDWELVEETTGYGEIEFDGTTPFGQIYLRLMIGVINFAGSPELPSITYQYAKTRQRLVRVFLNGKAAIGFTAF